MATLLSLVMALIIAAQSPSVPVELRVQALSVASVAMEYIQAHPDTAPVFSAANVAAQERTERDARAAQNAKDLATQEAKVREIKLTELRAKIKELQDKIYTIDRKILAINTKLAEEIAATRGKNQTQRIMQADKEIRALQLEKGNYQTDLWYLMSQEASI